MKRLDALLLIIFLSLHRMFLFAQTITVVEYHPAPGQFVNLMPEITDDMKHDDACRLATECINDEGLIHLGGYGGYATFQLDAAVQNKRGSDFRIYGNADCSVKSILRGVETVGGSVEPGIVFVGVGTELATAQWYELAGSEYYTTQIHDFAVTYYRPDAEEGSHNMPNSLYDDYIRWEVSWTDRDGVQCDSTGYMPKLSFHNQSYWPLFEHQDELSFIGGCLPTNALDLSGNGTNYLLCRYGMNSYGYADAASNKSDYSTLDIDWAVNDRGEHVDIKEINFVRVVCGIFQSCGWLGETSTEVGRIEDLHLISGYDENPIILNSELLHPAPPQDEADEAVNEKSEPYYDISGRRVTKPLRGLYIHNGKLVTVR